MYQIEEGRNLSKNLFCSLRKFALDSTSFVKLNGQLSQVRRIQKDRGHILSVDTAPSILEIRPPYGGKIGAKFFEPQDTDFHFSHFFINS